MSSKGSDSTASELRHPRLMKMLNFSLVVGLYLPPERVSSDVHYRSAIEWHNQSNHKIYLATMVPYLWTLSSKRHRVEITCWTLTEPVFLSFPVCPVPSSILLRWPLFSETCVGAKPSFSLRWDVKWYADRYGRSHGMCVKYSGALHAGGSFLFESVIESLTAAVFESMNLWDCVPRFVRFKESHPSTSDVHWVIYAADQQHQ